MKRMNHSYPTEGRRLASAKGATQTPNVAERSPRPAPVMTAQVLPYRSSRRADLAS